MKSMLYSSIIVISSDSQVALSVLLNHGCVEVISVSFESILTYKSLKLYNGTQHILIQKGMHQKFLNFYFFRFGLKTTQTITSRPPLFFIDSTALTSKQFMG